MGNVTLELTEAAFCKWRAQRISRRESIPENLWVMAVALYPQYKRSKICHRLGLNGSQFKQRLEGGYSTLVDTGFVLASNDAVKAEPNPNLDVQLTLQGKERVLTLCVGVHVLGQVLLHVNALL